MLPQRLQKGRSNSKTAFQRVISASFLEADRPVEEVHDAGMNYRKHSHDMEKTARGPPIIRD